MTVVNKSSFSGKTATGRASPPRARASSPTRKLAPIPFPEEIRDANNSASHGVDDSVRGAAAVGARGGKAVLADGIGTRYHVAPTNNSFRPKLPHLLSSSEGGNATTVGWSDASSASVVPTVVSLYNTRHLDSSTAHHVSDSSAERGVACVSDYFIPVTDHKQLVKEQDEEYPAVKRTAVRLVEVPLLEASRHPGLYGVKVADVIDSSFTPGALDCVISSIDDQFFKQYEDTTAPAAPPPSYSNICGRSAEVRPSRHALVFVDREGTLVFDLPRASTGKSGRTTIGFRVVDYSSLRHRRTASQHQQQISTAERGGGGQQHLPLSFADADFDCSEEVSIEVSVTGSVALHHPPNHVHHEHHKSKHDPSMSRDHNTPSAEIVAARDVSFMPPELPSSVPGPCRTLASLCIHTFRNAPETAPVHSLVVQWLKYQPTFFTKCTALSLERELLLGKASMNSGVSQSDVDAALFTLHNSMNKKLSVGDVIVPLLDHSIQLLLHVAGGENIVTMKRLIGVRADIVASLSGVNLGELVTQSSAATTRSASAPQPGGGGHTAALQNHLSLLVRVAVESGHALKLCDDYAQARRYYHIALLVAELLEGNNAPVETHIPFIRAIGDAELCYGDFQAASAAYERARALSEMAQKAADLSSETPSLPAAALVLSCEADISVCHALQRRDDAALHSWNRTEHMTYQLLASSERQAFLLLAVEAYMSGAVVALCRNSLQRALCMLQKAEELAGEYATWHEHDGSVLQIIEENIMTMMRVVKLAMALAAAEKGAMDECSILLKEASETIPDAYQNIDEDCSEIVQRPPMPRRRGPISANICDDGVNVLVSKWVTTVASLPLQEAPSSDILDTYDKLLARAENLLGKQSLLVATMAVARNVAAIADVSLGAAGSILLEQVERMPTCTLHPFRLDMNEAIVTCTITTGDFSSAVEALHRASTIWERCVVFRDDLPRAARLVGIGSYAVSYFCHEQASKTAKSNRYQADPPRAFASASFFAVVDHVVQATLLDAKNVSCERLLDAAEVRLCEAEYASALDLLGKALRIADTRNVMFLLDGLFTTRRNLSKLELEDRTRLLQERRVPSKCLTAVGIVLFQIAVAHEASRNFSKAKACYEQSIAAFEMLDALDHPAAVEILTGLGRVLLLVGEVGDALLNLEWAEDIFLSHHHQCGAFMQDKAMLKLAENLRQTQQAAHVILQQLNYVLVPHESLFTAVSMHV